MNSNEKFVFRLWLQDEVGENNDEFNHHAMLDG